MIECRVNQSRGSVSIIGSDIPDGVVILSRANPGERTITLRGGIFSLSTGAFVREDSEVPFGVEVTYQLEDAPTDRIVQQNLMLTPDFTRGMQGWVPGTGRTASTVADGSRYVGSFTGVANPVDIAAPTLVGHVESVPPTGTTYTTYTVTMPTTGGSAVATGDHVLLVHQQMLVAGVYTAPTVTGFTKLAETTAADGNSVLSIWHRTRVGGDSAAITPTFPFNSGGMGTVLWVRGAATGNPVVSGKATSLGSNYLVNPQVTVAKPSLVIGTFASYRTQSAASTPAITGVSAQYVLRANTSVTVTNNRDIAIGTYSESEAGLTDKAIISYGMTDIVASAVGFTVAFENAQTLTSRIIATGKAAPMVAGTKYLLTGRFKFTTPDLWSWQDVYDQGSWQHLKDTKTTWAAVRSSQVTTSSEYAKLFVSITDPTSGLDYAAPVQVITSGTATVNSWVDFSFYFTPTIDIPGTAVVRFFHGTSVREYAISWKLDKIGITPTEGRQQLYWFSGDSSVPANPEDYYFKEDDWLDLSRDSDISWAGAAGNSISVFTGPSKIGTTATCTVLPDYTRTRACEPVHLSDPISPERSLWFSLINISPLSYRARQTMFDVLNRPSVVAVSNTRLWASGTLLLKTDTMVERTIALHIFETGRILYLRNPDPLYPETFWYLAIGDVQEIRPIPNHRHPVRNWSVPFVRVDRPSGLIESASGTTWGDIAVAGLTWRQLLDQNSDWLDVMA